MSIDTAAILAARYQKDPSPLKAAVLGQGSLDINPYAALRALQLQKEAERYEMAQAAMRGQQYQNQPSMVEQALSPTPPQMPPQMQQPQGLPGMQQAQQPQPQGLPAMQQAQQPSPGLEGMPVPEGSDADYAGGGIVAFADEGLVQGDQLTDEMLADFQDSQAGQDSPGDPVSHQSITAKMPAVLKNIESAEFKPMTDQQYKEAFTKRRALIEEGAGADPYAPMGEQIAAFDEGRSKDLSQAKGIAMLAAAERAMQPGGLARGLAAAGGAFANVYGQAMQADKAEKRALMSMRFNLADAQRKEKMGLNREAISAADQARQDNIAAQTFGLRRSQALASVLTGMARATRPVNTGDKTSDYRSAVADFYARSKEVNNRLPENERKSDAELRAIAHEKVAPLFAKIPAGEAIDVKKRDVTVDEKSQVATEADKKEQRRLEEERNRIDKARLDKEARQEETNFQKALIEHGQAETARRKAIAEETKRLRMDRDYIRGTPEDKARMRKEIEDKYPAAPKPQRVAPSSEAAPNPDATSASAPRQNAGNKNSSLTGKAATMDGAPKGAKYGQRLPDGRHEVLDTSGKLIGYATK